MASETDDAFKIELLRKLAEKARQLVARPSVLPSKTLRQSLYVRKVPGKDAMVLGTPYFWAYYYHQGRGPVVPVHKTWLVWFPNPDHDPRIGGPSRNYPKRPADRKRLTKEQFAHGLMMNRLLGTPDDPMPYMVISKLSRPAKGRPFFEIGLRYYRDAARRLIKREFPAYLRKKLLRELNLSRTRTQRVRISFG